MDIAGPVREHPPDPATLVAGQILAAVLMPACSSALNLAATLLAAAWVLLIQHFLSAADLCLCGFAAEGGICLWPVFITAGSRGRPAGPDLRSPVQYFAGTGQFSGAAGLALGLAVLVGGLLIRWRQTCAGVQVWCWY